MVVVVMGVSGSGKSTIGRALAKRLGVPYIEGDNFHPQANVDKMAAGTPLNDEDRLPWLLALHAVLAKAETTGGCVMACSALKASYRLILSRGLSSKPHLLYLHGSKELLLERLNDREGHFFPPELLDSQLETLEVPKDAVRVSIALPVDELVDTAERKLRAETR